MWTAIWITLIAIFGVALTAFIKELIKNLKRENEKNTTDYRQTR